MVFYCPGHQVWILKIYDILAHFTVSLISKDHHPLIKALLIFNSFLPMPPWKHVQVHYVFILISLAFHVLFIYILNELFINYCL